MRKRFFGKGLLLCLSLILVSCSQINSMAVITSEPTIETGAKWLKTTVGGVERIYMVRIPPGISLSSPAPLVFFFHGLNTDYMWAAASGWSPLADKEGFVIVYPDGLHHSWNAGGCCGDADKDNYPDVEFVRKILEEVKAIVPIDPKRIYASGFSNGGFFAYRLGCEMADTFAAIAPVAGALILDPCTPSQPVSLIHIHGDQDTTVPFSSDQGNFVVSGKIFPHAEQGIALWAGFDGCDSGPREKVTKLFTHTYYTGCASGTEVEVYLYKDQAHEWFNSDLTPINDLIWKFFEDHPKQ